MIYRLAQTILKLRKKLNGSNFTELSPNDRIKLAQEAKTPTETLTILARDVDCLVCSRVAKHTNTPPETLTILARDEDCLDSGNVASNPNYKSSL
jgi:hypothetical protein